MIFRPIYKILCAAVGVFFSLAVTCQAENSFAPIEDWQITQRTSAKNGAPDCIAHTRQSDPFPIIFDFNIVMSPAGKISFEVITSKSAPWMYYGPEITAGEGTAYRQETAGHLWFDSGSKINTTETFEGATRLTVIAPQNASGLGEELSRTVYLKTQTAEAESSIFTYYMPNMSGVVRELEACRSRSQGGGAYPAATVASLDPSITPLYEPIKVRLEKAAAIISLQREKGGDWRPELVAAGGAALDALRLQDAYTALRPAVAAARHGAAQLPDVQWGLEKLVEVLILLERFDEARDVANLHPHKARFLGAIAVAEGLNDEAQRGFSLETQNVTGSGLNYVNVWVDRSRGGKVDVADGQAAEMRDILFLWGLGSYGQDMFYPDLTCSEREASVLGTPSAFFATTVFSWRDHAMLHSNDGGNPSHRRDLGIAAYLRGISMQQGGCLQTAKTDLMYALYELKGGSGADGWALMAELALLRQLEATGQIIAAQNGAMALQRRVEDEVGKDSLPWLQTGVFLLELAERAGEMSKHLPQAEEIIAVAARTFPLSHSLRMRLARIVAAGLVKENVLAKAVQILVQALGITVSPRLSAEKSNRYYEILAADQPVKFSHDDPYYLEELHLRNLRIANNAELNSMTGLSHLPLVTSQLAVYEYGQISAVLQRIAALSPESDEKRYCQTLAYLYSHKQSAARKMFGGGYYKGKLLEYALRINYTKEELAFVPSLTRPRSDSRLALLEIFPSYNRDILMPGTDMAGMSHLLAKMEQHENNAENFDFFLRTIQSADKSYALGALLARALLIDKGGNPERELESRRALEGDLYLRRQRGLFHAMLLQPELENNAVRAAIREKYQLLHYVSTALKAKLERALRVNMTEVEFVHLGTVWGTSEYTIATEKIQASLSATQAMVVWYPLEDETCVAIVRADKTIWKILPVSQVRLARQVSAISGNIKQVSQEAGQQLRPFPVADAAALYQALVAPLEEDLKGIDHIFTVQMGAVSNIPLGLLVTNSPDASAPQWLVNRFAITRMPALLDVGILDKYHPQREGGSELLFAAGAPVIEGKTDVAARADIAEAARRTALGPLEDIPNASQMMENIAKTLGVSTKSMLVGRDMNKASVLEALRKHTYKYLLFVTHGLVGGSTVGEPALYLSPPAANNSEDDGLLRASEVVGLNLDTDLALLTACKTSVAGDDGSEALAGLASAFLVAGARNVLASHWEVDSAAAETISTKTVSLMHDNNMDPAKALQLVMQGMSKKMDLDSLEGHPYYWAAFEVIGFPSKK